jgi:hypothetical protein
LNCAKCAYSGAQRVFDAAGEAFGQILTQQLLHEVEGIEERPDSAISLPTPGPETVPAN